MYIQKLAVGSGTVLRKWGLIGTVGTNLELPLRNIYVLSLSGASMFVGGKYILNPSYIFVSKVKVPCLCAYQSITKVNTP